jgi:O-antigen/teichoic acid export membrane protein
MLLPDVAVAVRWTFWLGALAVPFSYGTTFLLARAGPEVLGTYGILGVYASVVASVFYVGGSAVTIKYVSELGGSKRLSFLVSYFGVLCLAITPWLTGGTLWPEALYYLFGNVGDSRFQLLVVWLSPVYILLLLVISALKGMLDMAWAQALSRAIPIGSCLVYTLLFTVSPSTLIEHHTSIIWGVFLGLVLLTAIAGLYRFMSSYIARESLKDLRIFLPPRFWKYTAGVQGSSLLAFFSINLDSLLILHAGGVAVLGRYLAIMTIALAVSLLSGFLIESFVPILMNALARHHAQQARNITELYARMIFPTTLAVAGLEVVFAGPIIGLFGTSYADLTGPLLVLVPFVAVQALSSFFGAILVITGLAHYEAAVKALRIAIFILSFQFLWARHELFGAIAAWSVSEVCYHCVVLYLLNRKARHAFTISSTYVAFMVVLGFSSALTGLSQGASTIAFAAIWVGSLVVFLRLAKYSRSEIRALFRIVAPWPQTGALQHQRWIVRAGQGEP